MTALNDKRQRTQFTIAYKQWILKSGEKAYQGGAAAFEHATQKVIPATAAAGLTWLGIFTENKDATGGDTLVNVELKREVLGEWWDNDTVAPVTRLLSLCYMKDDRTVTANPAGSSKMGIVWGIDTLQGVAVEWISGLTDEIAPAGATLSYTVNDAILTSITSGAVYDIPTTTGASTVTLPAAAADGVGATFVADGTKNGHTVQYRDATGPANITTALTASKRHMVQVIKLGGKWYANAYVSP